MCDCEVTCSEYARAVAEADDPSLIPPHVVIVGEGEERITFGDGTGAVFCKEDPSGRTLREIYLP